VGLVRISQKAHQDTLRRTCVLHPVGSVGHVVYCGVSGARIVDALFFLLGWADMNSIKSVSQHVTPQLFFCSRWDLRVILYIALRPGRETSTHYFSCLGETTTDSTKRCQDTLRRTCVFASSDLCGSCSAFRCLWGVKHRALFFMLGWDWCGFHKKHNGTR
jgi:hypothetical protein